VLRRRRCPWRSGEPSDRWYGCPFPSACARGIGRGTGSFDAAAMSDALPTPRTTLRCRYVHVLLTAGAVALRGVRQPADRHGLHQPRPRGAVAQ
jgi:hypothetical protein